MFHDSRKIFGSPPGFCFRSYLLDPGLETGEHGNMFLGVLKLQIIKNIPIFQPPTQLDVGFPGGYIWGIHLGDTSGGYTSGGYICCCG